MKPPVRHFVHETAATPAAVSRVRERVLADVFDAASSRALLTELPDPASGAETRIRACLAHPPRRWPVAVPALLTAAAATGLFGVAAMVAATILTRDAARDAAPDASPSGPLASETWRAIAPTPHVEVSYVGEGAFGGTRRAPHIEWESGILQVEVEPGQGIDLTVHTPDADVRVIGTGFTVTRGALGTSVAVAHGRVAVVCQDGSDTLLGALETHLCLPTRPGALLGRAQSLSAHGAAPAQVLEAAEQGLAAGAEGPIRAELTLLRIQSLSTLGRAEDARTAAESWLAAGETARRSEVRHLAAHDAMVTGGCPRAVSHLEVLYAEGATGPELVQLADCVAEERPALAHDALVRALRLGVPVDQEAAIVERLTLLGSPVRP